MPGNSIAVSRELVAAGVEGKTADAVAKAIVKYSYQSGVENSLNRLENRVNSLENSLHSLEVQFAEYRAETKAQFYILSALIVAPVVGVYAPILQRLFFA
jgi:hypothetical protein